MFTKGHQLLEFANLALTRAVNWKLVGSYLLIFFLMGNGF